MQVLVEDLLELVIDVPDTKAIVVDGHELVVGLIVECNLVCYIHTYRMATDCFSALYLI